MKKLIFVTMLIVLSTLITYPVLADSEMLFTGNGIIKGVDVEDPAKITFNAFILIFSEFYDEGVEGIEPVGNININFHNTSNDDIDKGKFRSNYFSRLNITDGVDVFGDEYTAVIIIAYGQFNGEDDWSIEATFRDYGEPGNVKASIDDSDTVYIRLRGPNYNPPGGVPAVYATAWGDYEEGHFADLDGGNLMIHYQD